MAEPKNNPLMRRKSPSISQRKARNTGREGRGRKMSTKRKNGLQMIRTARNRRFGSPFRTFPFFLGLLPATGVGVPIILPPPVLSPYVRL